MKTLFRDTLITLAIAVVIFIGLQMTIQKYRVDGTSMNPNFNNGQFLLVNKIVYKFREPQRGDVIVFRYPEDKSKDFIKRIIAVGGDKVEVKNKVVFINDKATDPLILQTASSISTKTVNCYPWTRTTLAIPPGKIMSAR